MSKTKPLLSKSRLNSWYANPTTKVILRALLDQNQADLVRFFYETGKDTENMEVLVAEKRSEARLLDDICLPEYLIARIQDQIVFDDDEKSMDEIIKANDSKAVKRERRK